MGLPAADYSLGLSTVQGASVFQYQKISKPGVLRQFLEAPLRTWDPIHSPEGFPVLREWSDDAHMAYTLGNGAFLEDELGCSSVENDRSSCLIGSSMWSFSWLEIPRVKESRLSTDVLSFPVAYLSSFL